MIEGPLNILYQIHLSFFLIFFLMFYTFGYCFGFHLWYYQSAARVFRSEIVADIFCDYVADPMIWGLSILPGFVRGLEDGKEAA